MLPVVGLSTCCWSILQRSMFNNKLPPILIATLWEQTKLDLGNKVSS
jgi:hypothetical protein